MAPPDGWDAMPGARGCTPQSCAFRDHRAELAELGAEVVGMSAQPLADQEEFAAREHIPYPLIADPGLQLAEALPLPTFEIAGMRLSRRIALVARARRVEHVFEPRSSRLTGTPPTSSPGCGRTLWGLAACGARPRTPISQATNSRPPWLSPVSPARPAAP